MLRRVVVSSRAGLSLASYLNSEPAARESVHHRVVVSSRAALSWPATSTVSQWREESMLRRVVASCRAVPASYLNNEPVSKESVRCRVVVSSRAALSWPATSAVSQWREESMLRRVVASCRAVLAGYLSSEPVARGEHAPPRLRLVSCRAVPAGYLNSEPVTRGRACITASSSRLVSLHLITSAAVANETADPRQSMFVAGA
jgi:hypothetical protein